MKSWLTVSDWPPAWQIFGVAGLNLIFAGYLSPGMPWLAITFWVAAIWLFLRACRTLDEESDCVRVFALRLHPWEWWLCAAIVLVALAFRLYNLGSAPQTLHNDEAVMGLYTAELIQQPHARIYKFDEFSTTTLWYYFLAPGLLLFGQTQAALRFIPAILGALTVVPAYLFVRLLFDRRTAAITVALLATFHFHIHFSRVAVNNITDPLWGVLIYGLLYVAFVTHRQTFFALTGILIGLALHFYTGARLFIPFTGLVWLYWALPQFWATKKGQDLGTKYHSTAPRLARGKLAKSALLLAGGFLFGAALLIVEVEREPYWFVTRLQLEGMTAEWIQSTTAENGWTPLRFWGEQARRSLLVFFTQGERGYGNYYDVERALLSPIAAGFFAFGLAIALRNLREWRYQLVVTWLVLVVIFGGIFLRNPPAVQRYVTLSVVITLLMAIGLQRVTSWLIDRWPHKRKAWLGILIATVSLLAATSIDRYFRDYLPRETYGTTVSQTATLIGRHVAQKPAGNPTLFLGEGVLRYHKSAVPRYLAPEVDEADFHYVEPDAEMQMRSAIEPILAQEANGATILVLAKDEDTLDFVEEHYPSAEAKPLTWPLTGEFYVVAFDIEPE